MIIVVFLFSMVWCFLCDLILHTLYFIEVHFIQMQFIQMWLGKGHLIGLDKRCNLLSQGTFM